jgi:hypothetical protein
VSEAYELEDQSIELGDEPRAGLVGMQIEFRRSGHDPVTITLTKKHVWKAKVWKWPTACYWPMRSGKNSLTSYFESRA